MWECVLTGILLDGLEIKLQTSHKKVIKCSAIIISASRHCIRYREIPSKWRDDRKSLISVILSSSRPARGRQDIWQEVNSMMTHHYLRKCNFHTVHALHHTLWLNTMLKCEWGSWHLHWRRDSLTEKHTVAWAVTTTYDGKKYLEYSSDGKQSECTDPDTHVSMNTNTLKSNNVEHDEKNLWLIIVCVYLLLISTKSTLICLYNHSISSSLLLSFFFCRNLSLSHKKEKMGWGFFSYQISHAHTATDKPTW